jgi:hypothetical protein
VVQITHTNSDQRGSHTDLDYFITSITPQQASADQLLVVVRGH